jgi:uncharacterized protein YndB with AHSA1/START domain
VDQSATHEEQVLKTRVIQDDVEPAVSGVNRAAPVVASCETEITAAREVVWNVLTDIEQWPSWNPEVKSVSMRGPLSEGSEFRWKAGPGTITSRVEHVRPPRRVSWSGQSLGLKAMHVDALESHDGTTLVRTEESLDGLVARLFRARLQRKLEGALVGTLRHLKAEAERRTGHPAAERRS